MEDRGPSAYIAEFLGTLVLVFAIVMVLSTNSATLVVVALVHVFVLAMLVASLGGTSGAHFNPAVSVTIAVLRKIRPSDAASLLEACASKDKRLVTVAGARHYFEPDPGEREAPLVEAAMDAIVPWIRERLA